MRFKDIHGLQETKKHLISAVQSNHVAHAQLLIGNEGSASLPIALAYATYLNCENKQAEDACGTCSACSKNLKFIHPDVHFVFPVSSTKDIQAKDAISQSFLKPWREFLLTNPYGNIEDWSNFFGGENKQAAISRQESRQIISSLALKSFEGQYKVMIIWMPELMHPYAANGILKILEEPSDKTVFLLVSNNPDRLLVTITSRTQIVQIPPFTDTELSEILINEHQVESNKSVQIAHMASGNLRAAKLLMNDIEDDSHDMFREWMRMCFQKDFKKLIGWSDKFALMNKVAQKSLLLYGLNMLRETLIANNGISSLLRVVDSEAEFASKFGKVLNATKISAIYEAMNKTHYHLERNANPKISFMNLSISIAKAFV